MCASPRDESEEERLDRNLAELLQELRIALPGVQVLFAFLLTVPFQGNFSEATDFQRNAYFVTLLLTTLSSALLIAPTAFHRLTFRLQMKDRLVKHGNRMTIAGLSALGLAMTSAIVLVTDFLYSTTMSIVAGTFAFSLFLLMWVAFPVLERTLLRDES
jgi:fumarate reductase subunit C